METTIETPKKNKTLTLAFIPLAVGINLGIGALVQVLKLPVFLDSIGTIIAALMLGWRVGAIVGVVSFVITSLTIFPPAIYFSGTQICIALFTDIMGKRGGFKNIYRTAGTGALLAIIAACASAPIIYYLFGGITGNGISAFTIYLESIGLVKSQAVLISGISSELIDKTSQCLIAFFVLNSVPKFLIEKFQGGSLKKNGLTR